MLNNRLYDIYKKMYISYLKRKNLFVSNFYNKRINTIEIINAQRQCILCGPPDISKVKEKRLKHNL